MLLVDTINMYRGNKRHQRLFKAVRATMWNFTVCGAIIPDCGGIEDLKSLQSAHQPQNLLSTLKADDVSIGM